MFFSGKFCAVAGATPSTPTQTPSITASRRITVKSYRITIPVSF
jgi:hypothetical protein